MKRKSTIYLFILIMAGGCSKLVEQDAGITLPQYLDLQNLSFADNQRSFQLNGITFYGANGYIKKNDSYYQLDCVTPDGVAIAYQHQAPHHGILLASTVFNCLIADLRSLPAIRKITVRLFNNNGADTRVSLCDENGEIAETNIGTGPTDNMEYVLTLTDKKVAKLIISSLEAVVYSVRIE